MCSTSPAPTDTVIIYASIGITVTVICCHCQHPNKSKNPPNKRKSIINQQEPTTGTNVHPHFPFLVEDIQLLILFSLFSFYYFPPTSSTPFRPHVHWVWEGQICRLLQEIFNKGVIQPWRDYLKRCKMFPKVRWDSHKPLSSPVILAAEGYQL